MFTADQIKRFEARRQAEMRMSQPQVQSSGTRGRGGTATSLISEGGALGGAAVGAAAGSVVPIVGTAIGGLIGAGLGAFGGRLAENKIRDDRFGVGDAAKEGLLSAALSAPLRAGKYALSAGKAAKGGSTLTQALTAGADDAANFTLRGAGRRTASAAIDPRTGKALKTSSTGKMQNLGNKALASQYGTIGKNVARQTNPIDTISTLADYGILKPKDAEFIASRITGSEGILSKTVAKAAEGAGNVQTRGLSGTIKQAITENGLVDKDAKSVKNIINAQLKALRDNGNSPKETLKVMRNLEKRAANLQGKGGNYRLSTPERVDQANVLLSVRNELQDRLYNVAGGNSNLPKIMTPKLREQLLSLQPGNKAWQKFVDEKVMKAQDIGTLRSLQSPFVNIGKIIDEGDINSLTFGGRAGMPTGGTVASKVIETVAENVKNPVARAISKPLRRTGQVASRTSNLPIGFATRLGAANTLDAALSTDIQSNDPNIFENSMMQNAMMNNSASMPNTANIDNSIPQPSRFSPEQFQQALLIDLAETGGKNIQQIQAVFEMLNPVNEADEEKPLGTEAQKRASTSQSGLRSLQTLEETLASDPGAFKRQALPNPFGITAGLTNTTDVRAATDNVVDVIARLRSGAAITDAEAARFARLLPQPGDSVESAARKLANVRAELESFMQPATNSNLEEALIAYGLQ